MRRLAQRTVEQSAIRVTCNAGLFPPNIAGGEAGCVRGVEFSGGRGPRQRSRGRRPRKRKVERGRVLEARESSLSDAPRPYIDGGRRPPGGGRRQIPIGPSGPRQTRYGQAKPDADGAMPDRARTGRAPNPTRGAAETGGGSANRNSTS